MMTQMAKGLVSYHLTHTHTQSSVPILVCSVFDLTKDKPVILNGQLH